MNRTGSNRAGSFFMPKEVKMEEDIVISEIKMKRLRNLKMFKDKTDEEIYEFYRNREPKATPPEVPLEVELSISTDEEYEKRYRNKLRTLQSEYGDMNESDKELLRTLARLAVQLEISNKQIIRMQQDDDIDTRNLKNLGDYQRQLVQSLNDLQDKLGIARKQRKETKVDDVAIFMQDLKVRAKTFFDKKTIQIRCEKDGIELMRYWLNFPDQAELIHFEGTCWKCGEKRVYSS